MSAATVVMVKIEHSSNIEAIGHDARSKFDVPLSFGAIHIRLAEVSEIVNKEGHPETRVEWKSIEFPPS